MRYEISHTFEFYQQIGAARILMVAEVDCRAIIQPDMRDERGWSVNSIEVEADDDWHVVPEADEGRSPRGRRSPDHLSGEVGPWGSISAGAEEPK